ELSEGALVRGMLYTPDFENAVQTPVQQTPMHNQGLQPLQAAPVPEAFSKLMETEEADEDGVLPDPVPPVQAKPAPLQGVGQSNLIELPDGKFFDTVSAKYVEPPAPKVEMPAMDPETLALPEGKFFN